MFVCSLQGTESTPTLHTCPWPAEQQPGIMAVPTCLCPVIKGSSSKIHQNYQPVLVKASGCLMHFLSKENLASLSSVHKWYQVYRRNWSSKPSSLHFVSMFSTVGFSSQLSNYNSFEGVLYCKPHFDQLFKRTGSLDKSFEGISEWCIIVVSISSFQCSQLVLFFLLLGTPKIVKAEKPVDSEVTDLTWMIVTIWFCPLLLGVKKKPWI